MRTILYSTIVVCFILGGVCDATESNWKSAVIAWLFAMANGVIFFA